MGISGIVENKTVKITLAVLHVVVFTLIMIGSLASLYLLLRYPSEVGQASGLFKYIQTFFNDFQPLPGLILTGIGELVFALFVWLGLKNDRNLLNKLGIYLFFVVLIGMISALYQNTVWDIEKHVDQATGSLTALTNIISYNWFVFGSFFAYFLLLIGLRRSQDG